MKFIKTLGWFLWFKLVELSQFIGYAVVGILTFTVLVCVLATIIGTPLYYIFLYFGYQFNPKENFIETRIHMSVTTGVIIGFGVFIYKACSIAWAFLKDNWEKAEARVKSNEQKK